MIWTRRIWRWNCFESIHSCFSIKAYYQPFAQTSFSNLYFITSFYRPVSPYKNLRILWRKGIILYNYFNRRLRSLSKFFAGFYQNLYSAFSFRQRSLFDSLFYSLFASLSFRIFPLFDHDLLESADHLLLSLPKAFPDEFLLLFAELPFQYACKPCLKQAICFILTRFTGNRYRNFSFIPFILIFFCLPLRKKLMQKGRPRYEKGSARSP